MARDENPFVGRGETFYNGGTIDATDLQGGHLLGRTYEFEDINPSTGIQASPMRVKCMLMRNLSDVTLYGKRLVQVNFTTCSISGFVDDELTEGYVLDEYLPSTGLLDNDIGYIVIEGPTTMLTASTAVDTNIVAQKGWIVALTVNTTSGNSTAGRLAAIDTSVATTPLANTIINRIGRALTAITASTSTSTDVRVLVGNW